MISATFDKFSIYFMIDQIHLDSTLYSQQQQQQSFLMHSYKQQHGEQRQDRIPPMIPKAITARIKMNHHVNLHFPIGLPCIVPSWSHSTIGLPVQSPSTLHFPSFSNSSKSLLALSKSSATPLRERTDDDRPKFCQESNYYKILNMSSIIIKLHKCFIYHEKTKLTFSYTNGCQ